MYTSTLLAALAAIASPALATYKGFNYGSTLSDGNTPATYQNFHDYFTRASNLQGTSGFSSARLYTMIQAGTQNSPSEAFQAAIDTDTSLLLGMWASGGQQDFSNELAAFSSAISAHGEKLANLIVGISVGSEDLYRITPTGIKNKAGVGAGPEVIVNYINQLRSALKGTAASKALVGHVDTWTAYVNSSNNAAIEACDFLGVDAYPYFQTTEYNSIEVGREVFFEAYRNTTDVSQGKPVWITETGWPVSGPVSGNAVASIQNAKTYWDDVACTVLGEINTWWYTLDDSIPTTPSPSFGLIGSNLQSAPLYDLSCSGHSGSVPGGSGSGSSGSKSGSGSGSKSGSGSGSEGKGSSSPATYTGNDNTVTVEMTTYTTESKCPVTYTSEGSEYTSYSATTVTITTCNGGCHETPMPAKPPQSAGAQPAAPAPTASAPETGKVCPSTLTGDYEFPHLIVPISSVQADRAYGTQYNGTLSSTVSSLYNFDIPESDKGLTCSLVFLFPLKSELETSSFSLSGTGGVDIKGLESPALESTTYNNCPKTTGEVGSISSLTPGNSYHIASFDCPAGSRIGYELSATGSVDLEYFQDYNPSPIGLYITVC